MTAYILPFYGLADVQLVGKRKAIGYVSFALRRRAFFVVPIQEQELAGIADELTARGMEVYWDLSKEDRGHQAEIAALCKQLPPQRYCGKLRPSSHRTPWDMRRLFVVDPLAIESFLHSNRECLHGYPPTAEAFVDLVRSVWVEETNPLGKMITMAFSQRGLYGPRRQSQTEGNG
ncbi:MAG: hypothetical protein JNM40_21435 [Myxococcales bacterium]|nr:hypothetical protein [Myxococcales bacterium]